jgi:hypothetical protein
LEEQVEEATRQATVFSEIKRGLADDSTYSDDDHRDNRNLLGPTEEVFAALDYSDELHCQVSQLTSRMISNQL